MATGAAGWLDHREFFGLSLMDLTHARDLYHVQLLDHPNVVGTAVGLYLIRVGSRWPQSQSDSKELLSPGRRGLEARRLDNSEVRPYSWPCVLVFVEKWIDPAAVESGRANPDDMVPERLWLPDGRAVPLCVVEAQAIEDSHQVMLGLEFPRSFVGSGYPVVTETQGRSRIGTIGCVTTNGTKYFALTSRHALGDAGSSVDTMMNGEHVHIGTCSELGLTRLALADAYPQLNVVPTGQAFLNLDVGLIEIANVNDWTTTAFGIGDIGPVADARSQSLSLNLVGRSLIARGVASGEMRAMIKGLLFRYKSMGGFEYVADYLIGSGEGNPVLPTRPGDSGTVWYLEPVLHEGDEHRPLPQPLAIQWGGEVLRAQPGGTAPYALASSIATVCEQLDLDVVRTWNASLFRYWGAVGHYGIAGCAVQVVPIGRLRTLLQNNLDNISFPQEHITDRELKGLSKRFVPLADVPDLAWKIGAGQRGRRGANPENPNHFADMDQPDSDGQTLLDICSDKEAALNPDVWINYFNDPSVHIDRFHQGLIPFRVWQIFDAMLQFAKDRATSEFLCAAGVLAHYIGDACQPLHISAFHDGDPVKTETRTVHHRDGTTDTHDVALGSGVHAAYEDFMVNRHVDDIFDGLSALPPAQPAPVADGSEAAWATIQLMRRTIATISPRDLLDSYLALRSGTRREIADGLWDAFGEATIKVMGDGVETLASLWLSAWGTDDAAVSDADLARIDETDIEKIVLNRAFLPSYTLDEIGPVLGLQPATS